MKSLKTLKTFALILLIAALCPFSQTAFGAAKESQTVWTQLARQCETDFAAYEKKMEVLRQDFNFEITRMTQKQYTELDLKSDPRLIFIALSWPGDLSEKDEFWKANQDCANVHWEARKALRAINTDAKEKKSKVEDLKNCVLTRFTRDKLIAPFDQILSCYEKRAR